MENKKIKIVIIILVIAIILVGGEVLFINIFMKDKTPSTDVKEENMSKLSNEKLDSLIEKINVLNENFHEDSLLTDAPYLLTENFKCYRYKKDNAAEIKEKALELYIDPITDSEDDMYGMFKTLKSTDKETGKERELLYICLQTNCKVGKIEKSEIIEDKDDSKLIKFNDKYSYYIQKVENDWKFVMPVVVCDTSDANIENNEK